jgi:hypothetical protein
VVDGQSLAGIPSFRAYLHERVSRDENREMILSKALTELLTGYLRSSR